MFPVQFHRKSTGLIIIQLYIVISTHTSTCTFPFLWLGTIAKDRWTWEGFHNYCKSSHVLHLFTPTT